MLMEDVNNCPEFFLPKLTIGKRLTTIIEEDMDFRYTKRVSLNVGRYNDTNSSLCKFWTIMIHIKVAVAISNWSPIVGIFRVRT